jgi:hypothetical protein
MTLMRARSLLPSLLLASACHPPAVMAPGGPVMGPGYTGPLVGALEPSVTAPAPAPAAEPEPEPPPTWEWALSVAPQLAEHSAVDPGQDALARFVGWFDDGTPPRVHLLHGDACHAITGSMSGDGFHGTWREEVTTTGNERTRSYLSLEIARHGITETGPHGVTYARDERGKWQESGGFGTGCFETLVEHSMTTADAASVTFAGYRYELTAHCEHYAEVEQTCEGGGTRACERCSGVRLQPHAERRGFGHVTVKSGMADRTPVDCTQPCPADEWTPRLPRLDAVLKGRSFVGVVEGAGPVVFRSAKGCARELRRRKAAVAAVAAMAAAG